LKSLSGVQLAGVQREKRLAEKKEREAWCEELSRAALLTLFSRLFFFGTAFKLTPAN